MSKSSKIEIQDFSLWQKKAQQPHALYSFEFELTARCNLNCRHCFINLPANHPTAKAKELSLDEISHIADQAVELGAVWVLLSGGEPLLRRDFKDIYLNLKRKGLLVSVYTNATLIREEHIALFTQYPPRDIEVTIYGASQQTYEAITRVPGSYQAFRRGLDVLRAAGVRIRLKSMALRSNLEEIDAIAAFGRKYTKDFYRFDPMLHLRYDRDENRNQEILSERLTPDEVVALESADQARFESMQKRADRYDVEAFQHRVDEHLLKCGAGNGTFMLGYDGTFRLCPSLWAPGTTANLREVPLREAWEKFVPMVREMHTSDQAYFNTCGKCPIVNLCMNCPAHAYLETGAMEAVVPYFCQVAHARANALQENLSKKAE